MGEEVASPVLEQLRGRLNLYFCFINGNLPMGPRTREAFNASVLCNGAWEKEVTLISSVCLAGRGPTSSRKSSSWQSGTWAPFGILSEPWVLPQPQVPLP